MPVSNVTSGGHKADPKTCSFFWIRESRALSYEWSHSYLQRPPPCSWLLLGVMERKDSA